ATRPARASAEKVREVIQLSSHRGAISWAGPRDVGRVTTGTIWCPRPQKVHMPLGELSHAFTVTGVVIKDALIANTSMPSHRTQRLIATRFMSPDVVPEISCILSAKTPLGFELKSFVAAAQKFIDEHLGPVWGVAARLKIRRKTRRGAWALVFVDTEREASDDGWHDLTDEGLPLAKVF